MWPMVASEFVKARLPLELKRRIQAVAGRQLLTESAWLKRLVVQELQSADEGKLGVREAAISSATGSYRKRSADVFGRCSSRVYVRLRKEDRQLLNARAEARGMRPATYVSVLTRSHLRCLPPLPKDELLALRRSICELAAIGRNINQITKATNDAGRLPGSAREEFRAMLKVCEALRDNTKALLKANLISWESGYGEGV